MDNRDLRCQLDTLYWPTGNPAKEYNGDDRKGDDLYTDCLLALDARTGKLKWYYQFTPHDTADWDATEIPVLVDANFQGQPRKLVLHADRNGFFYVLDRTNGKLLLAKQFLKELTWASGIGADGRPILKPNQEPTAAGTRVCPSQDGATNFYSPSYIPATGLFYFQTFEKCSIYTKGPDEWTPGKNYLGGVQASVQGPSQHILRAMDINTGVIKWELTETPDTTNGWGVPSRRLRGWCFSARRVVSWLPPMPPLERCFWSFYGNQNWKASPMAYMFDGKEYLAVIDGGTVIAFGLGN